MAGQELLVGHGVQPVVPVILPVRNTLVKLHLQQLALQAVAHGRIPETGVPGVQHHALVFIVVGQIRMLPGDMHGAVHVPRDFQVLFQVFCSLVFKFLGQSQLVPVIMVPADGLGAVGREYAAVRALGRPQVDAVHFKFVLFGFAPEHGMVVHDQHRGVRPVLVEPVCGREAGKTAAHYDQVIDFA